MVLKQLLMILLKKIITKLVKQRKESASIFTEQGREDLAKDEISQPEYLVFLFT